MGWLGINPEKSMSDNDRDNASATDRLMGLSEIAEAAGLARNTVKRWALKGDFPAGKVLGETWISDRRAIDEWWLARSKAGTNG